MPSQIVIVDDDAFYAEILLDLLQMEGYEAQHFTSGQACLDVIEANPGFEADAFILDVVMPMMDGYQLCEKLRATSRFAKTPILFVSSKSSLEDRMRGYEAGGTDYLTKPAQPDELNAKLRLAIDAAATQVEPVAESTPGGAGLSSEGLLDYAEQLEQQNTTDGVLEVLLEQARQDGFTLAVLVRGAEANRFRSTDDSQSPIEKELLELAPANRAQVHFNQRLIVNYPVIACLARRVLGATQAEQARFCQDVALLVRMADLRAGRLAMQSQFAEERRYWMDLLLKAEAGISALQGQENGAGAGIDELLEEFLISVNERMIDLALEEDQEKALKQSLAEQARRLQEQLGAHTISGKAVTEPFRALVETLSRSL